MKRILVAGGAGYLGSVLVPILLDDGYAVRVLDRLYFGKGPLAGFADVPEFELVEGDIRDLDNYPGLLDGIDGIVHLASLSNDPSCDLDPELSRAIIHEGSAALALRAKKAGIERFVFASSCSVYGHGAVELLTESSEKNPVSTYASLKLEAEDALLGMADNTFVPVILRQATLFGASPRMRFDLAINRMVATAITREKIEVFSGGTHWRPFLHLKDASRVMIMCLEAPAEQVSGQVFNVGSDKLNFKVVDLAHEVASRFPDIAVEMLPGDEDPRTYRVSFTKLKAVLGYEPATTLDTGIKEVATILGDGTVPDPWNEIHHNVQQMKSLLAAPAVAGGESAAPRFIPFSRPSLGAEEEREVIDTLRSGWITTGPRVERFEREFAANVGADHAVAVSSCTAGLHLSLVALGVGPGDEVITSPLTWPSTANVILHQGAEPVFVDVDPQTLCIDPEKIEAAITSKTKAIIPVHMAGNVCDMDAITAIARGRDIHIVEDAAHALGAQYKGRAVGTISEFSCFSFYPIKNITTIEGGMVTVADGETAEKLRMLSNFGMSKDAWKRYSPGGRHISAEVVYPGYKYNMTDVQAAIGLHQLKKLDGFIATRERYATVYDHAFADVDEIARPLVHDGVRHAHHLYVILLDLEKLKVGRDEFLDILKAEKIGTGVHFVSLHLHKYYRETFGYKPGDFPNATWVSDRILSLPLYPKMSEKDLHDVVSGVKKSITYCRK